MTKKQSFIFSIILLGLLAAHFTFGAKLQAAEPALGDMRWELIRVERESPLYSYLFARGFEIVEAGNNRGTEDFLVPAQLESKLREIDNSYRVITDNYGKYLLESHDYQPSLASAALEIGQGSMAGYFSPDEMAAYVDSLIERDSSGIVSRRIEIGRSSWGTPIWMVKVSDNVDTDENEPEIFYNSLIHSREGMSANVLLYYLKYLLENYGSVDSVTVVVDSREMYFIPLINPDGYEINWRTFRDNGYLGMWRKSGHDFNGDGVVDYTDGVDINRNFDYKWGYDEKGSSSDPAAENYRGESPFSEPETLVLRDFMAARNFSATLNFHTYSPALIYPFGYEPLINPDSVTYRYLASIMTRDNGYRSGNVSETLGTFYRVNGEFTDWQYADSVYLKGGIMAFTAEIGGSSDGFWAPKRRIIDIAGVNLSMNLDLARLTGFWPEVDTVLVITDPADSLQVEIIPLLKNRGIKDGPADFAVGIADVPAGITIIDSMAVFGSLTAMNGQSVTPDRTIRLSVNKSGREVVLTVGAGEDTQYSVPLTIMGGPADRYDLDGDGLTNILDLLEMLNILSSLEEESDVIINVAPDLNRDGRINVLDLLALLYELYLN